MKSKHGKIGSAELAKAISAGDFASARRILAKRDAGLKASAAPERSQTPGRATSLADACGGQDATAVIDGRQVQYYAVSRTLDQWLGDDGAAVQGEFFSVLRGARQRMDELAASPALCHAANANAEDLLLVSPWQWGPSDPVLFLIGVMFCEGGRLVVEHYLARDEREEAAICQAFADRHARAGVLVTFSGKRSHHSHLVGRCKLHGVDLTAEAWDAPANRVRAGRPPHLDLRKECRARWGGRFRGCSLGLLERRLFGRLRQGLMPRAAAGEAYRNFVSTGDAGAMGDVMTHCAADLATMAQLVCVLLTGCENDGQ